MTGSGWDPVHVGWSIEDLLSRFKKRILDIQKPNLTHQSGGHGLEGTVSIEVINTMLIQSLEKGLRAVPVWPRNQAAKFKRMRAVGAFLVDAEINEAGQAQPIHIFSKKGKACTIQNPWPGKELVITCDTKRITATRKNDRYSFETQAGKRYTVTSKQDLMATSLRVRIDFPS